MKKFISMTIVLCITMSAATNAFAGFESKTYLYGGTTATYTSRVDKTGRCINTVCPDYFEIGSDGLLKYSKEADPLLIAEMSKKGILVTPFFSNHWSRELALKMLSNRRTVAGQLADAIVDNGLDGLDIDLQNITEANKDDFTDFIRLLREALPEDKILTVCVPANPYYTNIGWQGGYDYARLNEYCDHIFMMTYDESYPGGEPGAVASYWFIENSIKYGLQYVPREKLYIGIPFYGRYWTDTVKGDAMTVTDIERVLKAYPSNVWYDEKSECARAAVEVPADSNITVWGGKSLKAGSYDIWYDNETSYKKKLGLVKKYGIAGVGSWALGQEQAGMWNNYYAWLNGSPFNDIDNNWAQSYILSLNEQGIIKGTSKDRFSPEGNLTRAEAAALLVRLTGRENIDASSAFEDISGHWGEKYIAAAAKLELVEGVTDTMFLPDRQITREEFAVLASRYLNIEDTFDVTESYFDDVSPEKNSWSIHAIIKLTINGVLSGDGKGAFRPKDYVTRAEAAKVISLVSMLPTRFLEDEILPLEKPRMGPR